MAFAPYKGRITRSNELVVMMSTICCSTTLAAVVVMLTLPEEDIENGVLIDGIEPQEKIPNIKASI